MPLLRVSVIIQLYRMKEKKFWLMTTSK